LLHPALLPSPKQTATFLRLRENLLLREGEKIYNVSIPEVKRAIVCFQYAERIKSELILAAKLLERISALSGDELSGASKLYSFFLEALEGEINIARNVLGLEDFKKAGRKVGEAADKAHYLQYEEAMSLLSDAMSSITTSGQKAAEVLKEKGLL
jgi:hypothetical protein